MVLYAYVHIYMYIDNVFIYYIIVANPMQLCNLLCNAQGVDCICARPLFCMIKCHLEDLNP